MSEEVTAKVSKKYTHTHTHTHNDSFVVSLLRFPSGMVNVSNNSSLLGLVLSLNPENLRHLTCPVVTIIVFLLLHFESSFSSMEFFHLGFR